MKRSLGFFIAAALFAVATGLNLYNQGVNLKTAIGAVFIVAMLGLAIRSRREGG